MVTERLREIPWSLNKALNPRSKPVWGRGPWQVWEEDRVGDKNSQNICDQGTLLLQSRHKLGLEKAKHPQSALKWCAGVRNEDVAPHSYPSLWVCLWLLWEAAFELSVPFPSLTVYT